MYPRSPDSTSKPESSSARRISSQASMAADGSCSTRTSSGQVASPSPMRMPGLTPFASAAAVTGPSSGSSPSAGASAAGRRARLGRLRSAARSSKPGIRTHAIIEQMFYTNTRSLSSSSLRDLFRHVGPVPAELRSAQHHPEVAVSSEENKAVVRRFIEEVFVQHDPSNIEELASNESLQQIAPGTVQAFPDLEMTVEQLISEGDLVAVRVSATGTHKGEFRGIAP